MNRRLIKIFWIEFNEIILPETFPKRGTIIYIYSSFIHIQKRSLKYTFFINPLSYVNTRTDDIISTFSNLIDMRLTSSIDIGLVLIKLNIYISYI